MPTKSVDKSTEWDARRCKRIIRRLSAPLVSFKTSVETFPKFLGRKPDIDFQAQSEGEIGFDELPFDVNEGGSSPFKKIKPKRPNVFDIFNQSKLNLRGIEFDTSNKIEPLLQKTHESLMKVLTLEASIESTKMIQAFINFFSIVYFEPPSSKLTSLSAIEVGRCIVYTSGMMEDKDWYDSVEKLSSFTRWILMGHGLGLIFKNTAILEPLLPCIILCCALVEETAKSKNMYFTKKMIEAFLQIMSPSKFWKKLNSIKKLLKAVVIPEDILYSHMIRLLDYDNLNSHIFLDMAENRIQRNKEGTDIDRILIKWFETLNQVEPGPLTSNPNIITSAKYLVKLYFEYYVIPNHPLLNTEWLQRKYTDILTVIPSIPEFDVIRRVIKLHSYYISNKVYTILPDIDHSPRFIRYISNLYQSFGLFQNFVEFIFAVDPNLALALASSFALRNNNVKEVKSWQEDLVIRVESLIYGSNYENENEYNEKASLARGYGFYSRSTTPKKSQSPMKLKSWPRILGSELRNQTLLNTAGNLFDQEKEGTFSNTDRLPNFGKTEIKEEEEEEFAQEEQCISFTKNIYRTAVSPETVMNDFQIEYDSDLYISEDQQHTDDEKDDNMKADQFTKEKYQIEREGPDDSIIEYSFDDSDNLHSVITPNTPESSSTTRKKLKQKYSDLPIIGLQNWNKKHTPSPNKSRMKIPEFFEENHVTIPILNFKKSNNFRAPSKGESSDEQEQLDEKSHELVDYDEYGDFNIHNDEPYLVELPDYYNSPTKKNNLFYPRADAIYQKVNSSNHQGYIHGELEYQMGGEEGETKLKYENGPGLNTNLQLKRKSNTDEKHQEVNEGTNAWKKSVPSAFRGSDNATKKAKHHETSIYTKNDGKKIRKTKHNMNSHHSTSRDVLRLGINNSHHQEIAKEKILKGYEEYDNEEDDEVCLI
ncbi:hypothetical protein NADFUDRAFT_39234 [Nadsonia fulvescens var. elongata DSM 6958]|uniref:Uncharacterized protein n=1 Tax=Nadsonia fulvescens var. elongata DSM 6958 TaxID=857566 RepID=A0A1E3PSK7_9ASCO|nr:hypothetical protein NADFUDRAFT_39234 [Nadsonia fulvescens var. elongata DSM 6958]